MQGGFEGENKTEGQWKDLLRQLEGKPKFIGIKFCSECNNMLYPKEDKERKTLTYYCRLPRCNVAVPADDPVIFINRQTHAVDSMQLINTELAEDPTLKKIQLQCPSCDWDEVVEFQTLANRAKSNMVPYYVCCNPDCNEKWQGTNYKEGAEQRLK